VIRNQERGKGELTAPGGQQEERHDDTDGDDNGQVGYFVTDHLGRTPIERGQATKMINSNGTTFPNGTNFEIKYYSWGADQPDIPDLGTSFKYTGQRQAEAGLYFYNARWYDPKLGRFIQADSIIPEPGNPLAWDRYAYGFNNPVMYIDPSGHKPCDNYDTAGRCISEPGSMKEVRSASRERIHIIPRSDWGAANPGEPPEPLFPNPDYDEGKYSSSRRWGYMEYSGFLEDELYSIVIHIMKEPHL
jgi:RHS repeat-associated protein